MRALECHALTYHTLKAQDWASCLCALHQKKSYSFVSRRMQHHMLTSRFCTPSLFSTSSSSHNGNPQRDNILRGTTSPTEWRIGRATDFYRLWAQASCWNWGFYWHSGSHRLRGSTCQASVLPRHCWRHHDSLSGIGSWRWANSCSAGFTTVSTGVRSRCRAISSSSLWTRKLDAQFISRFKHRETC